MITSIETTTNQDKFVLFTTVPVTRIDPLTNASIQAPIIKIYACRVVMIPRKFVLNLTRKYRSIPIKPTMYAEIRVKVAPRNCEIRLIEHGYCNGKTFTGM